MLKIKNLDLPLIDNNNLTKESTELLSVSEITDTLRGKEYDIGNFTEKLVTPKLDITKRGSTINC